MPTDFDLRQVEVKEGSAICRQAWDLLTKNSESFGLSGLEIEALDDFTATLPTAALSVQQRQTIIDQAVLLFENFYPHLTYKQQLYSFARPVELLQDLRGRLKGMTDRDFHGEMMVCCNRAVDAHTLYGAPAPFRGAVAFLPFQVRAFVPFGFAVARVLATPETGGFAELGFGPGATITHWNGAPAQDYILACCDRFPSGILATEVVRGAFWSTVRPLHSCHVPKDASEVIHYIPADGSEMRALRLDWGVAKGLGTLGSIPNRAFSVSIPHRVVDQLHEQIHPASGALQSPPDLSQVSSLPGVFSFQYTGGTPAPGRLDPAHLVDPLRPDARFGYIRILSFGDDDSGTQTVVEEFRRILADVMSKNAPNGLIIDVRGNPGGDIQAAESLPQMLTDRQITPSTFHLANTPVMQSILRRLDAEFKDQNSLTNRQQVQLDDARVELQPWFESVDRSVSLGLPITVGFPLTPINQANAVKRVYFGRSAVLIDAITFSAAEMFAAVYQDHAVGPLIGADTATGGGGGNVWDHQKMVDLFPNEGIPAGVQPLVPLPSGVTMSIAIRRNLRLGFQAGLAVEDVGVHADLYFPPTSPQDVLEGYPGLATHACKVLGADRDFQVGLGSVQFSPNGTAIAVAPTLRNVDRLEILVFDAKNQRTSTFSLHLLADPSSQLLELPVPLDGDQFLITVSGYAKVSGPGGSESLLVGTVSRYLARPKADPAPQPSLIGPPTLGYGNRVAHAASV